MYVYDSTTILLTLSVLWAIAWYGGINEENGYDNGLSGIYYTGNNGIVYIVE